MRDEAYYFAPQAQTKIMNEGWASYWHSSMMTRMGLIDAEVIHYCDHHSGTLASSPDRLNPYKLGIELFRDIEERWNTGRFGKEFDECEDLQARQDWNRDTGLGRQKIFEVRRIHNDLTFIDEFLTLDFCRQYKLFSFGYNASNNAYEIESREFPKIKQQLLFNLTNVGRPLIAVRDGNYKNRGELFLEHQFNGVELKISWARDTLINLYPSVESARAHRNRSRRIDDDPVLRRFGTKAGEEWRSHPMNPTDLKIVEELNQALASEPNFRDGRRTLEFARPATGSPANWRRSIRWPVRSSNWSCTRTGWPGPTPSGWSKSPRRCRSASATCWNQSRPSKSTPTAASCRCGRIRRASMPPAPTITSCW